MYNQILCKILKLQFLHSKDSPIHTPTFQLSCEILNSISHFLSTMKYILIILFEEMFYFLLSCLMAGRQSIVLLDLCTIRGSLLSSDPSCILKSSFESRQKEGLNTFHYSRSQDSHSKDSCHQEGILLPIIFCSLYLVFSLLCDNSTE